jgi:hypothetical protein
MSHRPPKDANKEHPHGKKSLKSALDPIASDSAPSSFAVLGQAVKSWGGSASAGRDGGEGLLHDSKLSCVCFGLKGGPDRKEGEEGGMQVRRTGACRGSLGCFVLCTKG